MRIILLSAALVSLAACQNQKAAAPADPVEATKAIEALELAQTKAIAAKDVTGATAVYAQDAVFIDQNGSMSNGASVADGFKQMLGDPALQFEYKPGEKRVSADGSMAWSTATYTMTLTDSATKQPVTVKGSNLSVWSKQADGSWKLIADSNPGATTK